jgi:RNA polymerase sigma factor (TIGR02999 family)
MDHGVRGDLTAVLADARAGKQDAMDRLFDAIYGELHQMAVGLMQGERPGHTLQPSALVNEALVRMFKSDVLGKATNRRYLFAAAAQAMRRVLIDHARHRNRSAGLKRVPLDEAIAFIEEQRVDILALDEAIERLTQMRERQGQVVVLRYFAGLSISDVALILGVSTTTVENDWRIARAWLHAELSGTVP